MVSRQHKKKATVYFLVVPLVAALCTFFPGANDKALADPAGFSAPQPYIYGQNELTVTQIVYGNYGASHSGTGLSYTGANGVVLVQPNRNDPDRVFLAQIDQTNTFRLNESTNGGQTWANRGGNFGADGFFDVAYVNYGSGSFANRLVVVYSHGGYLYWRTYNLADNAWGTAANVYWNNGSHAQGVRPRISVDSGGRVHISYLYSESNALCYTSLLNGSGENGRSKVVSNSADVGDYQSIGCVGNGTNVSVFFRTTANNIAEAWSPNNGDTWYITADWDGRTEECRMPTLARERVSSMDTMVVFYTWKDIDGRWHLSSKVYTNGGWGGTQDHPTFVSDSCDIPVQSSATICREGTSNYVVRLLYTIGYGLPTQREFTINTSVTTRNLTDISETTNSFHWGHETMQSTWRAFTSNLPVSTGYYLAVAKGSLAYGPPPALRTYYAGALLPHRGASTPSRYLCFQRTLWEAPQGGSNRGIISASQGGSSYPVLLLNAGQGNNSILYVNPNSTTWDFTQEALNLHDHNWDITGKNGTSVNGGFSSSWGGTGNYLRGIVAVTACYERHYPGGTGRPINVKFPHDNEDGNPSDGYTYLVNEAGNTSGDGDYSKAFRGSSGSTLAFSEGVYRTKLLALGSAVNPLITTYAGIPGEDNFAWVFSDGTAPSIAVNTNGVVGNNGWYKGITDVTLTASDPNIYTSGQGGWEGGLERTAPGSGVNSITYRRRDNGGTWSAWTTVTGSSVALPGNSFAQGNNQIECYATDNVGNVGSTQTIEINLDSIPPDTTLTKNPLLPDGLLNGWYWSNPIVTISATDSVPGSGFYRNYYRAKLNNGSWPSTYTATGTNPVNIMGLSGAGYWELQYYAEDLAGNTSAPALDTWKWDEKPPAYDRNPVSGSIDSSDPTQTPPDSYVIPGTPDGSNGWWRTLPTIRLGIRDDASGFFNDNGFFHPFYRLFNHVTGASSETRMTLSEQWAWSSAQEYHLAQDEFPLPGEGIWEVSWFGNQAGEYSDASGRTLSPSAGGGFTDLPSVTRNGVPYDNVVAYDGTPPDVDVTMNPAAPDGANGWYVTQPEARVSSTDAVSGYWRTSYQEGDTAPVNFVFDNPAVIPLTDIGVYHVIYAVYDMAGNTTTVSRDIKWDNVSPTVSATITPGAPDGSNGWWRTQPKISLDMTDFGPSGFDRFEYYWDSGSPIISNVNPTTDILCPEQGTHTLHYVGYAGNGLSTSGEIVVHWDNVPPAVVDGPMVEPGNEWATWWWDDVARERIEPDLLHPVAQLPWMRDATIYRQYIGMEDAVSGNWYVDFDLFPGPVNLYEDYVPEAGNIYRYDSPINPADFLPGPGMGFLTLTGYDQAGNSFGRSNLFIYDNTPPVYISHSPPVVDLDQATIGGFVGDGTWPTSMLYPWNPETPGAHAYCGKVFLEWGTTTAYGNTIELTHRGEHLNTSGTYTTQEWDPVVISGLPPGTIIHYRFHIYDLAYNDIYTEDFTFRSDDYMVTSLETWDRDGTYHPTGDGSDFGTVCAGAFSYNLNPAVRLRVLSSLAYVVTVQATGQFSDGLGNSIPVERLFWRQHLSLDPWVPFSFSPVECSSGPGSSPDYEIHEYDYRIDPPDNQAIGTYQVPVRYVTYQP